jgi:NAD(P)-dependent dehydrogenase (short-subunit alcohol dehydrogenase family)
MSSPLSGRVAVVTGGGGGIGSASAVELARQGATVVVMDPGVGVQGEDLKEPTAADTAQRIRAAGGTAMDSTVSVTDRGAVQDLFQEIKRNHGSLDIVVNPAGILRFPGLVDTTEDDWSAVLDVHFNGYLNVLSVALPMMVDAGYGRVVGFTSGVGLARTSAGGMAYGCAKRAVAALTWELGPLLPAGVNVNALSPIAGTRMVRQSLLSGGANPKGLDLTAMPQASDMAPAAAYLSGDRLDWFRGQVMFSAGSELSVISPPRLLEAARTEGVADFGSALGTLVPVIFQPSEADQRTGGGSNPRLGDVFSAAAVLPSDGGEVHSNCLVVSDDAEIAAEVGASVRNWGMHAVIAESKPAGFDAVEKTLTGAMASVGSIDAIIVITRDERQFVSGPGPVWQELVEAHDGTVARVLNHAAWVRAGARYAAASGRPIRMIHVHGATTAPGRTAAQAVVQMARSVNDAPSSVPCHTFSISVETNDSSHHRAVSQLVARLAGSEDGLTLKGAELVAGTGWVGLRSHPGPVATATFGGPEIPASVDEVLRYAM